MGMTMKTCSGSMPRWAPLKGSTYKFAGTPHPDAVGEFLKIEFRINPDGTFYMQRTLMDSGSSLRLEALRGVCEESEEGKSQQSAAPGFTLKVTETHWRESQYNQEDEGEINELEYIPVDVAKDSSSLVIDGRSLLKQIASKL